MRPLLRKQTQNHKFDAACYTDLKPMLCLYYEEKWK